jgi:hypothetical protein
MGTGRGPAKLAYPWVPMGIIVAVLHQP